MSWRPSATGKLPVVIATHEHQTICRDLKGLEALEAGRAVLARLDGEFITTPGPQAFAQEQRTWRGIGQPSRGRTGQ